MEDKGASNDGASFAVNPYKPAGVPNDQDCTGCGPFPPSEDERSGPRQAFHCLSAIFCLQQSQEAHKTGLRLKYSLEAAHSPLLTVSWRGEMGWEGIERP